ncbi:MAG: xanthine dehydrogenase accessory protein XdhC [Burkholderiales bacterium]|nr:xanthine dehydrogenase accessory protein XdhC [Burkholderiales bacterium]
MTLRDTAARWLATGQPAVLVEITATRGSAPREAGTRMLVSAREALGTIGGGRLEWLAIATARRLLAPGSGAAVEHHYPLGPALGQCCGGAVTLRYSRLDEGSLQGWPAATPRFFLHLYGAGHVGRAIVRLLTGIDCRVQWIDERDSEFPPDEVLPPHIEKVCVEPVEAEVRVAPPLACYLVLTHDHDLDLRITEAILKRGDFRYLGLIGSRAKRARFLHRYEARGIPAEVLDRITCPIGVPGIEGKEPEVIAVAVVAQLLQLG